MDHNWSQVVFYITAHYIVEVCTNRTIWLANRDTPSFKSADRWIDDATKFSIPFMATFLIRTIHYVFIVRKITKSSYLYSVFKKNVSTKLIMCIVANFVPIKRIKKKTSVISRYIYTKDFRGYTFILNILVWQWSLPTQSSGRGKIWTLNSHCIILWTV